MKTTTSSVSLWLGHAKTKTALSRAVSIDTFWSCNGEEHGDSVPNVSFWAKAVIVPAVIASAEAVNVGLTPNNDGIEVFANTRRGLHEFERSLLERVRASVDGSAA